MSATSILASTEIRVLGLVGLALLVLVSPAILGVPLGIGIGLGIALAGLAAVLGLRARSLRRRVERAWLESRDRMRDDSVRSREERFGRRVVTTGSTTAARRGVARGTRNADRGAASGGEDARGPGGQIYRG